MIFNKKTPGQRAEQRAKNYLQTQGLKLISQNYSSRYGEIDLIMEDNDSVIFIEVRMRKNNDFGGALASIDSKKQKKISNTAQQFMSNKGWLNSKPMRFDAIGIEDNNIEWIKGAF